MAEGRLNSARRHCYGFVTKFVEAFKAIAVVFIAYALGCFVTGYYLVRWRTGQDLRTLGSGNLGAKNAGRILGRGGYIATSLLDIAKAAVAVLLARWAGLEGWSLGLVGLAVMAGHNWPVQLGFRGGKGIAAGYGAVLALAPPVAGAMWGVFLPITLLLRSSTLGGMAAFIATPLLALAFSLGTPLVITFAVMAVVVLFTHRENLREELSGRPSTKAAPASEPASTAVPPTASSRTLS